MNDDANNFEEPSAEELESMSRLLGDPAVWAEPSADVEDRVLAAITAESQGWQPPTGLPNSQIPDPVSVAEDAATDPTVDRSSLSAKRARAAASQSEATPGDRFKTTAPITDISDKPTRRRRRFVPLLAAAGLIIAILGAVAALNLNGDGSPLSTDVALAGTDRAPAASAIARLTEQPDGVQIVLEISGLDPAPPGFYYEAWLVKPEPRTAIGAGSFHLRGGGAAEIELWAGVSSDDYPVVTVTLESEADPTAQGQLLMIGEVEVIADN